MPPKLDGLEELLPQLTEYKRQLKEANDESHEGKRKNEGLWKIHNINHDRSRYIFDLQQNKLISKELVAYLIKTSQCDAQLLAKWKKPGYTNLCCLLCIQQTEFETVCICRIPKSSRNKHIKCVHCGCEGCS